MLKNVSLRRLEKTTNNFNMILPWYSASSSSLWCKARYRSSSQSCSTRRSAPDKPTHRFASWPPGCASHCFRSYNAPRPSYLHEKPISQSASNKYSLCKTFNCKTQAMMKFWRHSMASWKKKKLSEKNFIITNYCIYFCTHV